MIGTVIKKLLEESEEVVSKVGYRIYPLLAPKTTDFPYLIYTTKTEPIFSKMGAICDEHTVSVDVWCNSYSDAQITAKYVRTALDNRPGTYGSIKVSLSRFVGGEDGVDIDDGKFSYLLDFTFKTDPIF